MSKEGIDSFLLDCHTNENMAEIENTFSIKGFAIVVRLWQKIYSEKGYYCEWSERSPVLFLSQWFGGGSGVDENLIREVVALSLKIGIFDRNMYERFQILTSKRLQEQYFDVVKRRTEIKIIKDYLLISVDNFKENVNIIQKNVNTNSKNVSSFSTSKVKESKVKGSKDNNYVPPSANAADDTDGNYFISLPLNDKTFHQVTISDVQHYKELYPAVDVEQELRSMLGWLESNPANRKTRNGIRSFITKWLNKTQNQGGAGYGTIQRNNQQVHSERKMSRDYFKGGKIL